MSAVSKSQREQQAVQSMYEIAKSPENCRCADCDHKDPDWCSINIGIFICIKVNKNNKQQQKKNK